MEKVAAAVIEKNGLILLARRRKNKKGGGKLEFPGGKIWPEETPEDCLRRELREEFAVEAEIREFLGIWKHPEIEPGIELLVYQVNIPEISLALQDHEEILWVSPQNFPWSELLPLDREVARFLRDKNPSKNGESKKDKS